MGPGPLLLRRKPSDNIEGPDKQDCCAEEADHRAFAPCAGAVAKQFALVVQALTAARALEAQRQMPPSAPARVAPSPPPPRASGAAAAAVPPPAPRAGQPAPGASSTDAAAGMRPPAALRQDEDPWHAQPPPPAAVARALAEAQALAEAVRARCMTACSYGRDRQEEPGACT